VTDLRPLLQEFYREKLEAADRHRRTATRVRQYDANNTYQYIINREETQLSWVAQAIVALGGAVPESGDSAADRGSNDPVHAAIEQDEREAGAFVDRWRPRVEAMANARHRKMLNVILGETLEQRRFFAQAAAGRTDLLGRRGAQLEQAHGDVLPSRWIE
jgi:hypothetical protein